MSSFTYPIVRRDEEFSEVLHEVTVPDPYRWLEDVNSEETKKFVEDQNKLSTPYLEGCSGRDLIKEKLTKIFDHPKYSTPSKRGPRYFYSYNKGLENQSVLFKLESLDGEAIEYLNPNKLAEDGTISLTGSKFSHDGETHAYMLSSSGSDWSTIHIRKVESMEDYPEVIKKVKFSAISWTHDNKGFFYGCYPEQEGVTDGSETTDNKWQKLMYHRVGTSQEEDVLVMEHPSDAQMMLGSTAISDCGNYLVVFPAKGCKDNMISLLKIPQKITGKLEVISLIDELVAEYEFISNDDEEFVFMTNKDAPNWCLKTVSISNPENWKTLIPEDPERVLDWACAANKDFLLCCCLHDVKNTLEVRSLGSGDLISKIDLDIGCVSSVFADREQSECFFKFESMIEPSIIYRLNLNVKPFKAEVYKRVAPSDYDSSAFKVSQEWYQSKDGTKVPMFIMHLKDLVRDGTNPSYLYGYGGFNISVKPTFSYSQTMFAQLFGGVVAVANIRGGGEFGDRWHNGGRLLKKQNCFDDFASAAEFLVEKKFTSSDRLTIAGGSNGGLLTAASANQRPDLFGAAIVHVGVCDLLRFHKFTIGFAWISDYGNPEEEKHFKNLLKISPYHNVPKKPKEFPSMLFTTADHDDRVVPHHSYKMVSQLQHQFGTQINTPLLLRVDTKAGHGGGKPTSKKIEELTDVFCFVKNCLKLQIRE